jgi:hypothetical protein
MPATASKPHWSSACTPRTVFANAICYLSVSLLLTSRIVHLEGPSAFAFAFAPPAEVPADRSLQTQTLQTAVYYAVVGSSSFPLGVAVEKKRGHAGPCGRSRGAVGRVSSLQACPWCSLDFTLTFHFSDRPRNPLPPSPCSREQERGEGTSPLSSLLSPYSLGLRV